MRSQVQSPSAVAGVTDSLGPAQPVVSPARGGKKHVDSAVRDFRPYALG